MSPVVIISFVFFASILLALVCGFRRHSYIAAVPILIVLNIACVAYMYSTISGTGYSFDWIKQSLTDWLYFAGFCAGFTLIPLLIYALCCYVRKRKIGIFSLPTQCLILIVYSAVNLLILTLDIDNILHLGQGWLFAFCTLPAFAVVMGYQ